MLPDVPERMDSIEHFEEYGNFLDYPYLYYCRRCIRNFSTKIRVRMCNKCQKEDIVELPAKYNNVPLSRLRFGKEPFFNEISFNENMNKFIVFLRDAIYKLRQRNASIIVNKINNTEEEFDPSIQEATKHIGFTLLPRYKKQKKKPRKTDEELPSYQIF